MYVYLKFHFIKDFVNDLLFVNNIGHRMSITSNIGSGLKTNPINQLTGFAISICKDVVVILEVMVRMYVHYILQWEIHKQDYVYTTNLYNDLITYNLIYSQIHTLLKYAFNVSQLSIAAQYWFNRYQFSFVSPFY